jgi:hypothetical protein
VLYIHVLVSIPSATTAVQVPHPPPPLSHSCRVGIFLLPSYITLL